MNDPREVTGSGNHADQHFSRPREECNVELPTLTDRPGRPDEVTLTLPHYTTLDATSSTLEVAFHREYLPYLREAIRRATPTHTLPDSLRDQIAEALTAWTARHAAPNGARLPAIVRENSLSRADAVMPVVQAALDAQPVYAYDGPCYCPSRERAEKAEQQLARFRGLADELEAEEAYGGRADGYFDAAHRIRAVLDGDQPQEGRRP